MATEIVGGTGPFVTTGPTGHVSGEFGGHAFTTAPPPPQRISWGAIIGGAVAALGVWLLLFTFGLAVGLSTIDEGDSLRASGIFAGVWGVLTPLIALFVGGIVSSRCAGTVDRGIGALHGLVMWGLTALLGIWMVTNVLGSVLGGVASAGKAVGGAVGAGAARGGDVMSTLGIDVDDVLGPVNERLAQQGKPTVTANELQAVMRDVSGEAIRAGRVDREMLITSIAQHTALSRQDAEQVADQLNAKFQEERSELSQKVDRAADRVQEGALAAAETSGKALWGVFGALLLGLVSAVLGAITGVSRAQRAWARREQPLPPRPVLRERSGEV